MCDMKKITADIIKYIFGVLVSVLRLSASLAIQQHTKPVFFNSNRSRVNKTPACRT